MRQQDADTRERVRKAKRGTAGSLKYRFAVFFPKGVFRWGVNSTHVKRGPDAPGAEEKLRPPGHLKGAHSAIFRQPTDQRPWDGKIPTKMAAGSSEVLLATSFP